METHATGGWSQDLELEMVSHYLKQFKKDPKSQTFALLAETLRKSNLLDEAIEVCREGLIDQPAHSAGLFTLARCYLEKGEIRKTVEVLSSLVKLVPENLVAQKLLAKSLIKLNEKGLALLPLQYILTHNPEDEEAKALFSELQKENLAVVDIRFEVGGDKEKTAENKAAGFEVKSLDHLFSPKPSKETLTTGTMANLYLNQGFLEKAIGIYRSLLGKYPGDAQLERLLKELKEKGAR